MNQLLKNITFITSFAVLILSCQEDYEVKPLLDDSSQTSEIKSLHQANYQNKSIFKDITFDWESLSVSKSKNNNTNHIFKSNNFPQQKIFSEEGEIFVNQFLLAEKGDFNVYDYRLVKTFSIQPIKNKESFLDGFTGKIEYYTLKGKLVSVEIYENGNILYFVEGEEIKGLQQMEQLRFGYCPPQHMLSVMSSLDGCGFSGGGGSWRWVSTHHYTDWYDDHNNNGIAETHEFSHTQYTGITTSLEYVFNNDDTFYEYSAWGGHGGGAGTPLTYGSGTPAQTYENNPAMFECLIENSFAYCDCTENDNNCEEVIHIDTLSFDKLPCLQDIYDQIGLNAEMVANLLQQFEGEASPVDLAIQVLDDFTNLEIPNTDNPNELFGFTTPVTISSNGGIPYTAIYINKYKLENATDIAVAQTLIHEIMHAHIKLLVYNSSGNTGEDSTFADSFGQYLESFPDDHQAIATTTYLQIIQQELHNLFPDVDAINPYILNSIGEFGLQGTQYWESLSDQAQGDIKFYYRNEANINDDYQNQSDYGQNCE